MTLYLHAHIIITQGQHVTHHHTVNSHYTTGVVPTIPVVAACIRDHKYHVYECTGYVHAYNSHTILLQFSTSMFTFGKHS
ncbi:hypothetical protein Hanom_Chr16g01495691 [Helianthus anomalus]